jgi:hypothetical protein
MEGSGRMTRYEGYNGQLAVEGDMLVLTRDGVIARAAYGKAAPRRIPLAAISGVRSRPATRLRNGWLQILVGGIDGGEPATPSDHPDVILFTWAKREQFAELELVLTERAEANNTSGDPAAAAESADHGTVGRAQRVTDKLNAYAAAQPTNAASQGNVSHSGEQGILFRGTSHDEGRNAVITLYPDRIERHKAAKLTSLTKTRQDVEETPVRAISSIQAKKDGLLYTKVTVYASGNNIDFRFGHDEAERFRQVLSPLIRGRGSSLAPAAAPPTGAATPTLAARLRELAALRDDGILTEEEFAAQKAKLLGT